MSDNNYIKIGAIAGAISGAAYGFKNPSEKICSKLSKLKPQITDTMREYRDCFDIKAAGQAVREGKMNLAEYTKVANLISAFHKAFEKEQQIIDIAKIPFEQRTKTFRQAVKEANSARAGMWKTVLGVKNDFREKLIKLNVLNYDKFTANSQRALKKNMTELKELSKGSLKYIAAGIAAGSLIGYMINKMSNKS